MSKKFLDFARYNKSVVDKDKAINDFVFYGIDKLQSMFEYNNLPDTIPQKWLEFYLMCNGNCFITKVNGELYAFTGGLGGEYDVYYQPTLYTVANPALQLSKTYKIDIDGVLVRNDTLMQGMRPLLSKYGCLLVECDLTTRTGLINYRLLNVISASDDITNASAKEYLSQLENGKIGTIGENSFFDGVKLHNNQNISSYFSQLIEITQYIKASFYNEIGLNANYNLKREYISTTENTLADDVLLPLVDNMLLERKQAIEKINNMYGTDITVDFNSSWKTNNTQNEKEVFDNESSIKKDEQETTQTEQTENEDEQETQQTEQPEQPENEDEQEIKPEDERENGGNDETN